MLEKIRDATKGWFAWVILGALVTVFVFWGIYSGMGINAAEQQVAATVNGTDIPRASVEQLTQQIQQQAIANNQPINLEMWRKQALEELMMQTLLIQDAQKRGFVVDKKLVDKIIINQPEFQADGKFSAELFLQLSQQLGYTPQQLRQLIGDDIIVKQMQGGVMASAFVLPSEVDHFLSLENQQRDVQYITIPLSAFIKDEQPDENQVKEYYETHVKQWETPEQVSVQYVELKRENVAKEITVTEEQITKAYESNKIAYTQPEEREIGYILLETPENADAATQEKTAALADDLVKRLNAGEDFAKLAKEYSNDSFSAEKNGNLGWMSAGSLSTELDQPTFAAKSGAVIGPVKTQYGLEIIKVLEIKPASTPALSAVRDVITEQLREQAIQSRLEELQDELATLSYETPDSLTEVAEELNLPLKTTGLFTRRGGEEAITRNPLVQEAAFSENVLAGENSEILTIAPQDDIVLRIQEHDPAATLPLEIVRKQVVAAIQRNAAAEQARIALSNWVIQMLKNEINAAEVAQQVKGEWKSVVQLSRAADANQLPANIRDYAFALSRPHDETLSVGWKALSDQDYVMVQVIRVQDGTVPAQDSAEWKNAQLGLTMLQQQMDYTAYIEQLRDNAEIVYH